MRRATLLLLLAPALAGADAAIRAREGDIGHWIEYYQRDRQPQAASRPARQEPQRPEPVRSESATEKDPKR